MSVREILKYPHPVLREKAKSVQKIDSTIKQVVDDMVATMRQESGLGLAANQIGILQRIFVYDDGTGLGVLINPKIVSAKGEQIGVEGCLSVPGLQGEVVRAEEVVVKGMDLNGKNLKVKADGLLARIFQHEIDHLDGILFIDRADPDTLHYVSEAEDAEEQPNK
jgi:peptide deformylase